LRGKAARQRRHDRPHRPRQVHLDGALSARSAARFGGQIKSYAEITKGGTVRDANKT
jgi:hypothetical protein